MTKRYDYIETMRFFSILSVALAHLSGAVIPLFTGSAAILPCLYRALGTVGVAVFFIISGFLYERRPGDSAVFWAKKTWYVILPTLIAGILNYTVVHFGSFRFLDMLVYSYGGGSWLYYVTVLCLLFVIFRFLWQSDIALIVCMAVNVISVLLFATGVILYDNLPYPYLSSYLIFTNWIGFFALGVFIRRRNVLEKAVALGKRFWYIPLILFIPATYFYARIGLFGREISYFTYYAIPYELLGLLTVFSVSVKLKSNRFLMFMGEASFFIYLYHINLLQWMCSHFAKNNPLLAAVLPFVAVALSALAFLAAGKLARVLKLENLLPLIGGKKRLADERKK